MLLYHDESLGSIYSTIKIDVYPLFSVCGEKANFSDQIFSPKGIKMPRNLIHSLFQVSSALDKGISFYSPLNKVLNSE